MAQTDQHTDDRWTSRILDWIGLSCYDVATPNVSKVNSYFKKMSMIHSTITEQVGLTGDDDADENNKDDNMNNNNKVLFEKCTHEWLVSAVQYIQST